MSFTLFLIILNFWINIQTKISLSNFKYFFNNTYDLNNDSEATWIQFCDYFKRMEPDHNLSFDVLNSAFNAFDLDKNNKIQLLEMIDINEMQITYKPGHKQLHLGLTQNQNQMQIMWVSNPQQYLEPAVFYGEYPTKLTTIAKATTYKYSAGHFAFHGKIYRAVMTNLKPRHRYYYKVGDLKTLTFSQIKFFKAPPKKNQKIDQIRIAVFGDMGTYAPFGHMVSKMISNQNFIKPYDFIFLTGDIAYAGVSSQEKGQMQPIWDIFGQQSQKFAAYVPFMPGVGNHQSYYDYISYFNRYRLPKKTQNQTNLFFSFDYGQVHIVYISSQHPYQKGSDQYDFLQKDLKSARLNPNTQWIILGTHRAFYTSNSRGYRPITPLSQALEDLINQYQVDLIQNGHLHSYERSWPVYKNKVYKLNHTQKYYINPQAPIYVVQGTAGALANHDWVHPAPQFNLKRMIRYGYGQITIKANFLKYQFISLPFGKIIDTWYIVKDKLKTNQIQKLLEITNQQ